MEMICFSIDPGALQCAQGGGGGHVVFHFMLYFRVCLRLISFFQASVCCSKHIYFATKNVASSVFRVLSSE